MDTLLQNVMFREDGTVVYEDQFTEEDIREMKELEEFRKELQSLRGESSAETFTTRAGIDKANMKLDEVCRSLSEQRVDIKAIDLQLKEMSKKQVEHDMRMDGTDKRVDSLEEYLDRGVK